MTQKQNNITVCQFQLEISTKEQNMRIVTVTVLLCLACVQPGQCREGFIGKDWNRVLSSHAIKMAHLEEHRLYTMAEVQSNVETVALKLWHNRAKKNLDHLNQEISNAYATLTEQRGSGEEDDQEPVVKKFSRKQTQFKVTYRPKSKDNFPAPVHKDNSASKFMKEPDERVRQEIPTLSEAAIRFIYENKDSVWMKNIYSRCKRVELSPINRRMKQAERIVLKILQPIIAPEDREVLLTASEKLQLTPESVLDRFQMLHNRLEWEVEKVEKSYSKAEEYERLEKLYVPESKCAGSTAKTQRALAQQLEFEASLMAAFKQS